MRLIILALTCLLSYSCGMLRNALGIKYNYSNIDKGESIKMALDKRGEPDRTFAVGGEILHLYKDGYIRSANELVVETGRYSVSIHEEETFTDYVGKEQDFFKLIPKLGLPHIVTEHASSTIFRYMSGAVITQGPKVLTVVDKLYDTEVFEIGINSFSDKSAALDASYFIAPGMNNVSPEDFQFKEVKSLLSTSLKEKGIRLTDTIDTAKYVILVRFGIGDPRAEYKMVATFGGFGGGGMTADGHMMGGGFGAPSVHTTKTLSYKRWLHLEAIDQEQSKKLKQFKPVWKVAAHSEGLTGDLRVVIPALTYGLRDYLNIDTKRELYLSVDATTLNEFVYKFKANEFSTRDIAGNK